MRNVWLVYPLRIMCIWSAPFTIDGDDKSMYFLSYKTRENHTNHKHLLLTISKASITYYVFNIRRVYVLKKTCIRRNFPTFSAVVWLCEIVYRISDFYYCDRRTNDSTNVLINTTILYSSVGKECAIFSKQLKNKWGNKNNVLSGLGFVHHNHRQLCKSE